MKHKYVDLPPRILSTAHPGSTSELLVRATLLGFGWCHMSVSMPNGDVIKLAVFLENPTELVQPSRSTQ